MKKRQAEKVFKWVESGLRRGYKQETLKRAGYVGRVTAIAVTLRLGYGKIPEHLPFRAGATAVTDVGNIKSFYGKKGILQDYRGAFTYPYFYPNNHKTIRFLKKQLPGQILCVVEMLHAEKNKVYFKVLRRIQ